MAILDRYDLGEVGGGLPSWRATGWLTELAAARGAGPALATAGLVARVGALFAFVVSLAAGWLLAGGGFDPSVLDDLLLEIGAASAVVVAVVGTAALVRRAAGVRSWLAAAQWQFAGYALPAAVFVFGFTLDPLAGGPHSSDPLFGWCRILAMALLASGLGALVSAATAGGRRAQAVAGPFPNL